MRSTTLDLRVTVAYCPCGVFQCGCSHVSRLSQPQMSCRFVSLSVLQSADHVPAPCHAPALLRARTRFFFLSNPSIDVSQWVHRPNFRASSTRNTDGCQLAVRAGDELQPRVYLRRLGLDWPWQVHDGGRLRLHQQHGWCVQPRLGGPICGLAFYSDA